MGQASSVPVVVAPADPKATPQPKQKELKIPSAWKGSNQNEFVMISPQSDISNPSHFRGKKLHSTVNLADTSATMQRRAYRASKVCSKVPQPHTSAGVPIPSRFYFQAEGEDNDDDDNENAIQKKQTTKKQSGVNPPPKKTKHPTTNHPPPPMSKFAAKCIKAKQQLSECWKERDEAAVPQEERIVRHYSQRDHVKPSAAIPESNFQPVWKEAESYPPVLPQKYKVPLDPVQVAPKENEQKPDVISPSFTHDKPPIVTSIRVSDIVRTFSQETATSTVLQKSTGSGSTNRSSVASTVLQHPTANAAIFRPLSSEPASQPQVKPSLSTSTDTSSSLPEGKAKKRASIEKQSRHSSEPSTQNRRSEISVHMQRQIDEQIMVQNNHVPTTQPSRVHRLRQQYQQEVEKKFLIVQEESRKQNDMEVTNKKSDRFSIPRENILDDVSRLTVAEKRQVFESKPRHASVPKQRVSVQPTLHTKASTAANTRSVSAPRASQLLDGSALLMLAGSWEVPQKKTAPATTQLPVLLQMAGWKPAPEPSRRSSLTNHRLSHASSQAKTKSATTKPRLSHSSDQINSAMPTKHNCVSHSSDGKENQTTEKMNVAKPQVKDIKVRHSIHFHTEKKEKSEDATQIRKAASFDTMIPSKRPATWPKGRSIAFMLQQAYFGNDDDDDSGDCVVAKTTHGKSGGYLQHLLSPRANRKQLVEASPAFSVDSVQSTVNDSVPVVSDQAMWNADFLFHRDGFPVVDASLAAERPSYSNHSTSGFALSTLDSRSRIVTSSVPAVVAPPSTTAGIMVHKERGDEGSLPRRVRFSEETVISSSSAPKLETKLSDLTEDHHTKDERESVAMSIPRIDSIPEEEEEPNEQEPPTDKSKPPIMRWSYRTSTSSTSSATVDSRGVTPLLGNKATSKIANTATTTNSPYLRFKQAKDKFASFGGGIKVASPAKTMKLKPTKRTSPTKTIRQNLVTSRIAAMEGRRFQRCSGDSTETIMPSSPAAKLPKVKSTKSPLLQRVQRRFHSATPPMIIPQNSQDEEEKVSNSPMLINGQVVLSPDPVHHNIPYEDTASVVSNDDSEEDVFGAILHPTTIDEDGDSTAESVPDTSAEDDAFDRLLNYTESYEEPYADHSAASTVLQTRSLNIEKSTILRNQLSSDTTSIASLASSSGDTATVPHWLLHQGGRNVQGRSSLTSSSENSSVVSAVGRMKGVATTSGKALPFREVAPVQLMQLQRHRYSEDPSVVEPPRTWRAMAVAAQDRALSDRSNFQ
jgi:hypothetical protein